MWADEEHGKDRTTVARKFFSVAKKLDKPVDGAVVLNGDDLVSSNESAQEFAGALEIALSRGYGFVPFLGAGLSAPSGVPLIWELKPYLQRCIGMALGVEPGRLRPWNPRTDQWPAFAATEEAEQTLWLHRIQEKIDTTAIKDKWDRDLPVLQEALGAIAEWRTALQFLSRLAHEDRGEGFSSRIGFVLDEPRQEVVDACLRAVLKGKRPTLGHRMLAALGGLLRLDIILTTNFDDLLELAFAEARNPLTVFELHLGSALPAWSAVASQRSLIKLHGNRHSLRADYTLDASPPVSDLWRFVEYLMGGECRRTSDNSSAPMPLRARNQLLVIGASGAERRTSTFIGHAWKHLDDLTVFWICHTKDDVARACALTRTFQKMHKRDKNWLGSVVLRHTNPGLLFLHVFQFIRHTLPTAGLVFPSASRLSIPPLPSVGTPATASTLRLSVISAPAVDPSDNAHEDDIDRPGVGVIESLTIDDLRQQLSTLLKEVSLSPLSILPRLIVVSSAPCIHGVTSVCAGVFEDVENTAACIWLELNDVSSADDLFEQMLGAIYYHLGAETWLPVFIADDAPSRADEVRRLAQSSARPWIFFLNARETPGSNRHDYNEDDTHPNGWIDKDSRSSDDSGMKSSDDSDNRSSFVSLLTQLCPSNAKSPSITIVLLCRSPPQKGTGTTSSPIGEDLLSRSLASRTYFLTETHNDLNPIAVAQRCIEWIEEGGPDATHSRRRFVHRLVLMQRTRFLASIWSSEDTEGSVANANAGSEMDETWIADLARHGLVRQKLGGFIWLHARSRNALRTALGRYSDELPELHWELALWYHRVLAASQSPYALFEAVYHTCQSAAACWALENGDARHDACARLAWAASALRQHSFLVQTLGYSRGSCRRLESIRDKLCSLCLGAVPLHEQDNEPGKLFIKNIRQLRIACTELMRAIAREVGEVTRAYERHRELRALLICDNPRERDRVKRADLAATCAGVDKPQAFIAPLEWLRWWKWNGMLGLASRSYAPAVSSLSKGLRCATIDVAPSAEVLIQLTDPTPTEADCDRETAETLKELVVQAQRPRDCFWGLQYDSGDAAAVRVEVLRSAEQYIACRLQQYNIEDRLGRQTVQQLPAVDKCASIALKLADAIAVSGPDGRASGVVAWCRSRLCLHRGHIATFEDDHRKAMKWFTDAEAALNLHELRRFGTDRAIVELYRAEAGLRKAANTEVTVVDGNRMSFQKCIDREVATQEDRPNEAAELRRRFWGHPITPDRVQSSFREAGAVVRDAIRFLNRAEDILARRRRNTAWTTWYFHRRLRSISLAVWASLTDRREPIPFLGVEAAPEGNVTLADALVDEAARLIRMDVYRLATIVDEYSSCAMALRARLLIDHNVPRLSQRQRDMHALLCRSLEKLKQVYEKRTTGANAARSRELYESCNVYYELVIARCQSRCECLRHVVR